MAGQWLVSGWSVNWFQWLVSELVSVGNTGRTPTHALMMEIVKTSRVRIIGSYFEFWLVSELVSVAGQELVSVAGQ